MRAIMSSSIPLCTLPTDIHLSFYVKQLLTFSSQKLFLCLTYSCQHQPFCHVHCTYIVAQCIAHYYHCMTICVYYRLPEEVGHDHVHTVSGRIPYTNLLNVQQVTQTSLGGRFKHEILLKSTWKRDLAQYPARPPIRIRVNEANSIRWYSTTNWCVSWRVASYSCLALEFTAANSENEWISLATSSRMAYIIAWLMVGGATHSSDQKAWGRSEGAD